MDENKRKKLHDIKFIIKPCCGLCKYGNIYKFWGTCSLHKYTHLKHTGLDRNISINLYGVCPSFQRKNNTVLETHEEYYVTSKTNV